MILDSLQRGYPIPNTEHGEPLTVFIPTPARYMKTPTQQLETMFAPDITVHWDNMFKGYMVKATNDIGMAWLERYYGIKLKLGKFIPASLIEQAYDSMLKCGLCVERIDN